MWKLIIVWNDANFTKDEYEYNTEKEANEAGIGMQKALGNQIRWWGITFIFD